MKELAAPAETSAAGAVRALALLGQQSWVVVGEPAELHRLTLDGEPIGAGLPLPWVGEAPRLLVIDEQAALWVDREATEVRLERGALRLRPGGAAPAELVVLGQAQWLAAHDGRLWLHGPSGAAAIDCALELGGGRLLDGAPIAGDGAALLVDGDDEQSLIVIDLANGRVRQRMRTSGALRARFAPSRGHAVLQLDDDRLQVIDLRFGAVLADHRHPARIRDFALDASGERLLVQRQAGAGEELLCLPYRTLFQRQTPAVACVPARPEPEPLTIKRGRAAECVSLPRGAPAESRRPAVEPRRAAAAREAAPLLALKPCAPPTPATREQLERATRLRLDWIAASCRRALAEGWDSGRLSFADADELPFECEAGALLGHVSGRASRSLEDARRLADACEADLRALDPSSASPAARLAREHELSALAVDALWVVTAPALRGELARAYAMIANDPGRPLCDELLVAQILGIEVERRRALSREIDHLIERGLLILGAGERPFARLSARPVVIGLIAGDAPEEQDDARVIHRRADRMLAALTVDGGWLDAIRDALAAATPNARLVVRGRAGGGGTALIAALAAQAGRDLGLIDSATLSPDELRDAMWNAWLRGWLPCIAGIEHAADDPRRREALRQAVRAHPGPLAFRCAAATTPPLDPGYLCFDLPSPGEDTRAELWHRALEGAGLPSDCARDLAVRYRVGPGLIHRIARSIAQPAPDDTVGAVEAELRRHRSTRIGEVATRVERLPSWDNVVLPPEVIDSIRELVARMRHRRVVFERWGFDRLLTSSRGLTALFSGGPGTGKSLVGGLIARELGYDLYRIDLSRVLSKWVGETEKNLATVFDAAEDGEMVLLFDEADSLFSRRSSEVRGANDRYANLEVNFLLQRLDAFEGIAILTTNAPNAIDPAFKRRLAFRLSFPFPDEEMRARLWDIHLPPELPIQGELDLALLAKRYQLSGGYIRNATVRAAFLAAEEDRPVTQDHLERAVRLEYRELGKIVEAGLLE
jgi:hypothetical protein